MSVANTCIFLSNLRGAIGPVGGNTPSLFPVVCELHTCSTAATPKRSDIKIEPVAYKELA